MIEQLDLYNGVNSDGDVVSLEDYLTIPYDMTDFGERVSVPTSTQISPESISIASLVQVREEKLLSAKANHPAMSGETIERADALVLGEAAQAALDAYMSQTDLLRKNGAQDVRATRGPHYRDLMIELAKGRGITGKEINAVLALVSPSAIVQTPAVIVEDDSYSRRGRPTYRDGQSAAANDY